MRFPFICPCPPSQRQASISGEKAQKKERITVEPNGLWKMSTAGVEIIMVVVHRINTVVIDLAFARGQGRHYYASSLQPGLFPHMVTQLFFHPLHAFMLI